MEAQIEIYPVGICAVAFPFDKMVAGMLAPVMIEDTAKIVNEAIKEKVQVNLIINNREGGNAPLIAEHKDGGQVFNLAIF